MWFHIMGMKRGRTTETVTVTKKTKPSKRQFRRVPTTLVERKYNEYNGVVAWDFGAATNVSVITLLGNISAGDSYNQRTGRKIQLLYCTYDMEISSAAFNTSFKADFVLDRQSNGSNPAYSTIYDTTTIAPAFAQKNIAQYDQRFEVIRSERQSAANVPTVNRFRGFINLRKLKGTDSHVQWFADAVGTPSTNNLLLTMATNWAAVLVLGETTGNGAGLDDAYIRYTIRVVWTDL